MSEAWFNSSIEYIDNTISWLYSIPGDLEFKKPEAAMLISRQLLSLMVEINDICIQDCKAFSLDDLCLSSEDKRSLICKLESINQFVQNQSLQVSTQDYSNHNTRVNMPFPSSGGHVLDINSTEFLKSLFENVLTPVPIGVTPDYYIQGISDISTLTDIEITNNYSDLFTGIQNFYDGLDEIPAYWFGGIISVILERICAGLKVCLSPDFFSPSFSQVALSIFDSVNWDVLESEYTNNLKSKSYYLLRKKVNMLSSEEMIELINEEIETTENALLDCPYSLSFSIFLASEESELEKVRLIKELWQKDDNEKYLKLLQYIFVCQKHLAEYQVPEQESESICQLPAELATPHAKKLWERLQAAGHMDENCQPRVSRTQMAVIAFYFSQAMAWEPRWTIFEKLWGKRSLHKDYETSLDQVKGQNFAQEIKSLLVG